MPSLGVAACESRIMAKTADKKNPNSARMHLTVYYTPFLLFCQPPSLASDVVNPNGKYATIVVDNSQNFSYEAGNF